MTIQNRSNLFTGRPLFAAVLCAACGVAACAQAEPASDLQPGIDRIQVGLDGKVKIGYWTPVHVTVHGGGRGFSGNLELTLPDSDGMPASFVDRRSRIEISADGKWSGWRYVKLGRLTGTLQAVLRDSSGQPVDRRSVRGLGAFVSTDRWVVSAGRDVGIEDASRFLVRKGSDQWVASHLVSAEQFPDRWYGYEGVDVLLVPTGEAGPLEQLDERQMAAVHRWLELGGRLLLTAGHRAAEVFDRDHPLYAWRPGDFQELDHYWKASGLESFAHAGRRLLHPEDTPLAVFTSVRGEPACLEGAGGANDRPLVMEYAFGLGQITYVALDLDEPPLAGWSARSRLVAQLLQRRGDATEASSGREGLGQVTHIGYDDLVGQLRGALDQFTGITLVHFSWIAALLVLYIVLLGPIDFLGLRKLGRPHWTWVTFPAIVVGFCLLAAGLSNRWKGQGLKVNQVDVVDVDVERSIARGTTWINMYSPAAVALDLSLRPDPHVATGGGQPGVLLSWQGLPGTGLGGMNTRAQVGLLGDTYEISSGGTHDPSRPDVRGFPIHTSSTKTLASRWWLGTGSVSPGQLTANSAGLLKGQVVNPLDVELTRCSLYFRNWAFRIEGSLAAGESVELEYESPLDLKWQLTRRHLVESSDVSTPWDRADYSDVPRIMEMLMFHGAAGGRTYTRLSHRYQGYVDLSKQLRTGKAILVGTAESPASHLVSDGKALDDHLDHRWTYYRIAIPVRPEAAP